MKGDYTGDYTSNINLLLGDGSTFSFAQTGTMNQVKWIQASSSCQDKPFPALFGLGKRAVKFLT